MVQPLWKSIWQFFRNLDMRLAEDPAITLLDIHPEDSLACNKNTCSTMFIAALFCNSQKLEGTQVSLNGGMDAKMWYIYPTEYYSAIRNNEFMKFLDKWIDLENIILSEAT